MASLQEGESMTLEEAIKHCEEIAKNRCNECASDHRQLAEWLKELKHRKEMDGYYEKNRMLMTKTRSVITVGIVVRQYWDCGVTVNDAE